MYFQEAYDHKKETKADKLMPWYSNSNIVSSQDETKPFLFDRSVRHRIGYNNKKSKNASYHFKCYTRGNPVCSKQHNLIIFILSADKHLVQTYVHDIHMWTQAFIKFRHDLNT